MRLRSAQQLIGVGIVLCAVLTTARAGQGQCTGDCNGDGEVTINELLTGVNIALGESPLLRCGVFDANGDGEVTVNELLQAVNDALNAQALRAAGACLQPGQTESLVSCADRTPVRVFLCMDSTRCLRDASQLQMLSAGSVQGGAFSLTSCTRAHLPLVFEAEPAPGTTYRIISFGLAGTGRAGHAAAADNLVLSPVSEAAVRLLADNGLQNFNAQGAEAVIAAVQQANAGTSFTGLDVAAAAVLATNTAQSNPQVQMTIEQNKLPTQLAVSSAVSYLNAFVPPAHGSQLAVSSPVAYLNAVVPSGPGVARLAVSPIVSYRNDSMGGPLIYQAPSLGSTGSGRRQLLPTPTSTPNASVAVARSPTPTPTRNASPRAR
jgi:hypothetical protein